MSDLQARLAALQPHLERFRGNGVENLIDGESRPATAAANPD